MTERIRFNDVIVLLPGIGGSVLRKGQTPLWEPSLKLAGGLLRNRTELLEALAGDRADLDDAEHDSEVTAAGLIGTPVTIPGLAKVNQYRALRRMILSGLDVVRGDPSVDGPPANYFEFAYDWRRDNRVSALRLKEFIDRELPKWRSALPYGRPKVVFVCHSMGGLVAKFYADVLGGWTHTRSIITFGTPFRGSVQALEFLSNGYRKCGIEIAPISELLAGYTSVYQLLPRHPVVLDRRSGPDRPTAPLRVSELEEKSAGSLSVTRARCAYTDFHQEMGPEAAERTGPGQGHLIPVVGYGHSTLQAAVLSDNGVATSAEPLALGSGRRWLGTGDGTVPALSAIPVELSEGPVHWWENGTHSSCHTGERALARLLRTLGLYGTGISDLQGPDGAPVLTDPGDAHEDRPVIALEVEDVHLGGEPVTLRCAVREDPAEDTTPRMELTGPGRPEQVTRTDGENGAAWVVEGLPAGTYEATVTYGNRTVADVFEVW
ncbi:esterase/lipase family protein [Streptomyces sp. 8N616]|uniref:esterase/lipase family protein n=1 Tax=Streptomyces sp. 8N616 TaxID=3457414 RepID=UPI003FD3E55E